MRSVLFVSKPIAPPFHDGAKCLVRDVATHLPRSRAIVLTTASAAVTLPGPSVVEIEPVYPGAGSFSPALSDNARVLGRLLLGPRADVWHFVFAPNLASSAAGHAVRAIRRVPTVQTVASAPRTFEHLRTILFGDRVVVLSQWMHDALVRGGFPSARIRLIPPPVTLAAPSAAEIEELRARLAIPEGAAVLTYPGDIDRSSGARLVAASVPVVLSQAEDAFFVFACRNKTPRAQEAETLLRYELAKYASRVRFARELPSLLPLLATSRLVLFPVDDLYGKVDLPIALLEAMVLGIPVVALDRGPLRELAGAALVAESASALAETSLLLLSDESQRLELGEKGRKAARTRHDPDAVAQAYEAVYDELVQQSG